MIVIDAGGLGHVGIQVLKALSPSRIIVVDRYPAALELGRSIGADEGVVAIGTQVEVEVLIDFVGEGGATSESIVMLREADDYLYESRIHAVLMGAFVINGAPRRRVFPLSVPRELVCWCTTSHRRTASPSLFMHTLAGISVTCSVSGVVAACRERALLHAEAPPGAVGREAARFLLD